MCLFFGDFKWNIKQFFVTQTGGILQGWLLLSVGKTQARQLGPPLPGHLVEGLWCLLSEAWGGLDVVLVEMPSSRKRGVLWWVDTVWGGPSIMLATWEPGLEAVESPAWGAISEEAELGVLREGLVSFCGVLVSAQSPRLW